MNGVLSFLQGLLWSLYVGRQVYESINDSHAPVSWKKVIEDASSTPIPEENLALAKEYGVTATVLVVTSPPL